MVTRNIVWFDEVGRNDIALVGGKGANLGEMTRAKIPVPPGFIVTSDAYSSFIKNAGIEHEIYQLLQGLDVDNDENLQNVAKQAKKIINSARIPEHIKKDILEAYHKLGKDIIVAARSSATAEDLPEASFAGQQRTYLNVSGEDKLLQAVQGCWASLFESRAIFYRTKQNFDHSKVKLAVPVQKMVQSEVAGVMFTVEPISSDTTKIEIEAAYGLGESVVSGDVTPDSYIVDKESLNILNKTIARQTWALVRNTGAVLLKDANIKIDVHSDKVGLQKLSDENIVALARIAKQLEKHYQFPQDIEWALESGKLYILQTRPITTIKKNAPVAQNLTGKIILSGLGASPGVASGPVNVIHSASAINEIKEGDILVTETTTPDFVPAMKRAVAIITNHGGRTCHAAIVSRELGIPCIVGTNDATDVLKKGQVVTIDGSTGVIYEGKLIIKKESEITSENIRTKTRVYVNLSAPDLVDRVAKRNVDGVGLLRAEFIVANIIREHPRYMLAQGRGSEFTDKLASGLTSFVKAFNPRPVVYRTTDFKTNEYRNLKGGEEYEFPEENPMLGYRGCSRYIGDTEVFKLEIAAIRKVRQQYNNLYVMIPFIRTVSELSTVKKILEAEGLVRSKDFKLWMMVEIPSNVILIDKFLDVGIDGVSIGSNDLTQLTLGLDRDNAKLAELFDERNEAVVASLERIIKATKERGVTCSICGQAPSDYPELVEKLVELGITSVSVSPDMIDKTRQNIAEAESKLSR